MQEKEKSIIPNFNHIEPAHKGWVLMIGGFVLVAHTLGLLGKGVNIVLIGLALYMIIFGFLKAKLHIPLQKVVNEFSRKK